MPRSGSGIVTVRPFEERDLEAASDLCDRARAEDASVEPFSQRLSIIATGPRALLPLWRVAEGEDGALHGIAFAALREARQEATRRTSVELYAAVLPALRRQGLGRQLLEPSLAWAQEEAAQGPVALRSRVRDSSSKPAAGMPVAARPGEAFLRALGFVLTSAQLQLHRQGPRPPSPRPIPRLALRLLNAHRPPDVADFKRLSDAAWAGAEETFPSRADELAQLISELDRFILLAQLEGRPAGYLSAIRLGRAFGIEEVAVMPEYRRAGIGRELVAESLRLEQSAAAILTVSETNRPARALYKSLGFSQSGRRLIFERVSGAAGRTGLPDRTPALL